MAEVVAMMTGVPVQRIAQAEGRRLKEMAPKLKSEIIGQDDAIDKIVKAIQRNRIGLQGSKQAYWHIHVSRTHRRGKNAPGQETRRIPI